MASENISKQLKRQIFNAIIDNGILSAVQNAGTLGVLVSHISNVDKLKSQDPKYGTFMGDFKKHCIDNDDWDFNFLFVDRMLVLESDEVFQSFIESLISPEVIQLESEIYKVVSLINTNLKGTDFILAIYKYSEGGLPIHFLMNKIENGVVRPSKNCKEFQFLVDNAPTGRTDYCANHFTPSENDLPCFVLVFNSGWDDYGVCSWYDLFWHKSKDSCIHIGNVKIIHKTELSSEEIQKRIYYCTKNYMPERFNNIEGDFVSLGQSQSYYDNLKKLFPDEYEDILWALQDCAIYPRCEEAFCNHKQFHSLIRDAEQDSILREEKFRIKGLLVEERYRFSYKYLPEYADSDVSLYFSFSKKGKMPHRLYALIGENGTGKTQFLTKLPRSFSLHDNLSFSPHMPIFSRVLTVSTCIYDEIEEPVPNASFTYGFCGLQLKEFKAGKGSRDEVMQAHLINALVEIEKKNRTSNTIRVLSKMLPKDIIDELVVSELSCESFQRQNVKSVVSKLSSGEACLLITFCDVIAYLRNDTLLLFDEPETHLHPKAVTNMMNTLYTLLEEFDSYAIIATHSPLVIREVLAECVYVIKRVNNHAIVGKIKKESFGSNIDELNEEIFGQQESKSFYHRQISRLISDYGMDYGEVMKVLKSENVEPGFNLRLFVRNLFAATEHEKN